MTEETTDLRAALPLAPQGHCASDCCDNFPRLHVHGSSRDYEAALAAMSTDLRAALDREETRLVRLAQKHGDVGPGSVGLLIDITNVHGSFEAIRHALSTPEPAPALDFDAMRVAREWPTPDSMRRTADALDTLTPARYGDILRWFADRCDEWVWHVNDDRAQGRIDAARLAAKEQG